MPPACISALFCNRTDVGCELRPVSQDLFLAVGMFVPAPDWCGLGTARDARAMPDPSSPDDDERKAKRNAYMRVWRKANVDKIKDQNAAYHAANREKRNAQTRAYHAANAERFNALNAAYRAANAEKLRAQAAAYRAANREKIRAQAAARRAAAKLRQQGE